MKFNKKLFDFFCDNHKRGAIGVIGAKDPLGLAIRAAQRDVTEDNKPSLWSHVFIFGEMRPHRRRKDRDLTFSPYIFESDIDINILSPKLRSGAQENWIGKWCHEQVENAAIIDLDLNERDTNMVLATALQLVEEQIFYPVQELIGYWLAIVMDKRWVTNPLNDPHAMYCSSFVRYCYREAGKDFLDNGISLSDTTPEDIVRAGKLKGKVFYFRMSQII